MADRSDRPRRTLSTVTTKLEMVDALEQVSGAPADMSDTLRRSGNGNSVIDPLTQPTDAVYRRFSELDYHQTRRDQDSACIWRRDREFCFYARGGDATHALPVVFRKRHVAI